MNRGFASIGLVGVKDPANLGGTLRAAFCYSASMVAVQTPAPGLRHGTDTPKAWMHIPVVQGPDIRELVPFGAVPVAVDLVDGAESLVSFQHPRSAFYVFGPENGTLGGPVLDWCERRVMVPTNTCMNLAAAVNVLLYDRMAKADRMARGIRIEQENAA